MIRVRLSIGILVVLLAGCLCAVWSVRHHTNDLLGNLTAIETALAEPEPDYTAAADAAQVLCDGWDDAMPVLRILIPQEPLRDISATLARLSPMLDAQDDGVGAELAALRCLIADLYDAELPYPNRVL